MTTRPKAPHVVIIGAGFCGLAAGYELSKHGIRVTLFEREQDIGGLAGSFQVDGARVEKFYHHWFTHDKDVMNLIDELGATDRVVFRPTLTGVYYAGRFFRLSSPADVLRFTPLPLYDRFRLGGLALYARRVKNWRLLEEITAMEWLRRTGGGKVYKIVWEPLLRGKFGEYASEVSAVWMWNKLKLRGRSRGQDGREKLAYYRGGFAAFGELLASRIAAAGGTIRTGRSVEGFVVEGRRVRSVISNGKKLPADAVVATPALPIIADLMAPHVSREYLAGLRRIRYLANVCLVLELNRSLSPIYWLNVNDAQFPFVAVVEHTNLESAATYGGRHIVYLSKYLAESASMFTLPDHELLKHALQFLQRMFPDFERNWILDYHVWRAPHSQPLVERNYGAIIPPRQTPILNFHLASMAQIYPEDRGTNYAVREGRKIARMLANEFNLGEAHGPAR